MAARSVRCFQNLTDTILIHFIYALFVSDNLSFTKTVQQIQREGPREQLLLIYIYKYFSTVRVFEIMNILNYWYKPANIMHSFHISLVVMILSNTKRIKVCSNYWYTLLIFICCCSWYPCQFRQIDKVFCVLITNAIFSFKEISFEFTALWNTI